MSQDENGTPELGNEPTIDPVVVPPNNEPAGEAEAEVGQPTEAKGDEPPKKEEKKFSQEELDAIVRRRLSEDRRRTESRQALDLQREQLVRQPVPKVQNEGDEEYIQRVAMDKARQLAALERDQQELHERQSEFDEHGFAFEQTTPDYFKVITDPSVPISDTMAEVIRGFGKDGPAVAYTLGKNLELAASIYQLPPIAQAVKLGELRAGKSLLGDGKGVTKAPSPLSPVGAKPATVVNDPRDPRSIQNMTPAQWIAARNKQTSKK